MGGNQAAGTVGVGGWQRRWVWGGTHPGGCTLGWDPARAVHGHQRGRREGECWAEAVGSGQGGRGVLVVPKAPRQGDAGAVPALCLCPCAGLGQGKRSWLLTPAAPLPALVLAVSICPSRAAAEVP